MRETIYENFPFPEANDFGNGALDLQVLAEAFDAKITAMIAGLTYMSRRETIVLTSSADSSAIGSGSQEVPFDTILYNNGIGTVTNSFGTFPVAIVQGSYLAGAYVQCVTTGALTAHHWRALKISASVPHGPNHTDVTSVSFTDTSYDTGSGALGDFLACQGTIDYRVFAGNPFTFVSPTWSNDNIAGGTTVVKAGALMWMTRISDLDT